MQLKRPTLKDMRTFIIKKGRPLSGAVFLLCLVGGYSFYTHQDDAIDALVADAEARAADKNSDYLDDSGDMGGPRKSSEMKYSDDSQDGSGASGFGGSGGSDGFGDSRSSGSGSAGKKSGGSDGADSSGIHLVQGLNGVIRSHPFRDPFDALDPVPDGNAATVAAGTMTSNDANGVAGVNGGKGRGRTGQGGVIVIPELEPNGYYGVRRGYGGGGYGYAGGSSYGYAGGSGYGGYSGGSSGHRGSRGGSSSSGGSSGASYSPWQGVEVRGIIGGDVPMVIIGVGNNEGTYGIGEGPGGLRVVSISDTAVVLSDGNETRTFSVY